jgi:HPt (histidine-containing phosphotransfer) domain-containing protein
VIHNIKGVAGFLGAVRISALASELDSAVRAGCEAGEIDRLTTALIQAQRELAAGVFARADQAGAKS